MQTFMIAMPSACESFGFAHIASRKRFARPSSSPWPRRRSPRRISRGRLPSGLARRLAVLREHIERVRPVAVVDELEVGIARVIGDRTPVPRIAHAVDDRAVSAGGLAEAAAMLARGERAEFAIDEGYDLAHEIVGIAADRAGIDVLVPAQAREAVGHHQDHRAHALIVDQASGALGQVLAERLPVEVRPARSP